MKYSRHHLRNVSRNIYISLIARRHYEMRRMAIFTPDGRRTSCAISITAPACHDPCRAGAQRPSLAQMMRSVLFHAT
ncbi:hypothetical protein AB1N83_005629 [Pleurotus pulmonarius]